MTHDDNSRINEYIVNESEFYSVEDMLTGAKYLLSLDWFCREEPTLYREIVLATTLFVAGNEDAYVSLVTHVNYAVSLYRNRLFANPTTDPVRYLLQCNGWESVQECMKACFVLLQSARCTAGIARSDVAALSGALKEAQDARSNSTPVRFNVVKALCDYYEVLTLALLKGSVLDMGIYVDERHVNN